MNKSRLPKNKKTIGGPLRTTQTFHLNWRLADAVRSFASANNCTLSDSLDCAMALFLDKHGQLNRDGVAPWIISAIDSSRAKP